MIGFDFFLLSFPILIFFSLNLHLTFPFPTLIFFPNNLWGNKSSLQPLIINFYPLLPYLSFSLYFFPFPFLFTAFSMFTNWFCSSFSIYSNWFFSSLTFPIWFPFHFPFQIPSPFPLDFLKLANPISIFPSKPSFSPFFLFPFSFDLLPSLFSKFISINKIQYTYVYLGQTPNWRIRSSFLGKNNWAR